MTRGPRRSPRRRRRSIITRALTVILVLGVVGLVIPRTWTDGLWRLVQTILPGQTVAADAADAVLARARHVGTITVDQYRALVERNARLERLVASLRARVQQVEAENRVLLASRQAGIGTAGRLIPASVVAGDLAHWRRQAILDHGSLSGIASGDAVVTRNPTIDEGTETGVQDGLAVLMGEALVGVVDQAGMFASRVRLLTDPETQLKVWIGRATETGFDLVDGDFWMVGRGEDHMRISDVVRQDVERGVIAPGDTVLASPVGANLPAPLVVGTIETIRRDPKNGLLAVLEIRSAVEANQLRRVYVYDPG